MVMQSRKVTRVEKFVKSPGVVGAKPKGKGFQVTIPMPAAKILGLVGQEGVSVWLDEKNRAVIFELIR